MTQPGTVFTAENAKDYLKNYNTNYLGEKTWLEAFKAIDKNIGENISNLDISESAQHSANLQDYSENIAQAYKNAMIQQNQIANAKLSQYASGKMLDEIDVNLDKAYDTYLQNYLKNEQTINSDYQKGISNAYDVWENMTSAVNKELDTQSKNTADYLNAHFDYLKALYEKNSDLFVDDQFQDYVNRAMVGGQLEVTGLKDLNVIRDSMFDLDEEGNYLLNERGKDFFRQIQQLGTEEGGYSFGSYLYDTNKDLYEWSISANPYDSIKDAHGNSNRASALGAIGLADEEGYINDGKYKWKGGTALDNYYDNTPSYDKDTSVGRLRHYEGELGQIVRLSRHEGSNRDYDYVWHDFKDEDNATVKIGLREYDNDMSSNPDHIVEPYEEYKLKLGQVLDDEFTTDFDKQVGGITHNSIYYYDGNLYVGRVINGSKTLRKLTNADDSEKYNKLVNYFENPKLGYSDIDQYLQIKKNVTDIAKKNHHITAADVKTGRAEKVTEVVEPKEYKNNMERTNDYKTGKIKKTTKYVYKGRK